MQKVLLISYHFPPDSAIGAVRAGKFAKYLPEFGWEPIILTVKERYYDVCDYGRMDPELDRLETYRSVLLPGPLQLYSMLGGRGKTTVKTTGPIDCPENGCGTIGRTKLFKKFLSSLLRLPDPYQGWILNVALSGYRILKKNGIDVFVTSGPPMSTHLGGLLLKKMTGARWIADFRDPWMSMLDWEDKTFRSAFGNRIEKWLESRVVKAADQIVSTAPSVTRYFQSLLTEEQKRKAVTITNGHDESDFDDTPLSKTTSSTMRVCHAGALYLGRNPEPLFRTLSDLLTKGAIERNDMEIEFIGEPNYNGHSLSHLVEKYALTGVVALAGKMPFDQCLKRLKQSDGLLLFAQGQPQAIPGKVFEYLRMNKPILAIVDEGDTKDLLGSSPHCFVANPHQGREIEEKLLEMVRTVRENGGREVAFDRMEQYERRNLTSKLASLLPAENKYRRPAGVMEV